MTKQPSKGMFDDLEDSKDTLFDNLEDAKLDKLEDSKHGLFAGLGKRTGGVMQGLAAKLKGKTKVEKQQEVEEDPEDKDLTTDDEEEEEDEEDDDDAVAGPSQEGTYDATEWEDLEVGDTEP